MRTRVLSFDRVYQWKTFSIAPRTTTTTEGKKVCAHMRAKETRKRSLRIQIAEKLIRWGRGNLAKCCKSFYLPDCIVISSLNERSCSRSYLVLVVCCFFSALSPRAVVGFRHLPPRDYHTYPRWSLHFSFNRKLSGV